MVDAFLVEAVRSPICSTLDGGGLTGIDPMEMVRQISEALIRRTGIDFADVDRVLVQCGGEAGGRLEKAGGLTWPLSGLPARVPAITIDRWCGTGQEILHHAARSVVGRYDVVVAVGVETTQGCAAEVGTIPGCVDAESPLSHPRSLAAELLAHRFGIDRDQVDAFAARSNQRAAAVAEAGEFQKEIVPIEVPAGCGGGRLVVRDELIDFGTSVKTLGAMLPTIQDPEVVRKHPEASWITTPGNSARRAVGAAAVLLMSRERVARLGIEPRARLRRMAVAQGSSAMHLAAPLYATERILAMADLTVDRLDHVEVDEEFACVPLAWQSKFAVDFDLFNPRGGALALGNPRACGGIRQLTTMLGALEATGGRMGLQTMSANGGMAYASLIERC